MASESFIQACLDEHNRYRKQHGCPPLKIRPDLNKSAQAYANKLLRTKTFQHSDDDDVNGENLYYHATNAKDYTVTAAMVIAEWYNEIKFFNYKDPNPANFKAGHFTQLIWKDTKFVGTGKADKNGTTYVVCKYYPPGNVMKQFTEKCPKPKH